jgi:hypothetical protein
MRCIQRWLPPLLLLLLACNVDGPLPSSASSTAESVGEPIVNGQADSGHPASVALTVNGQAFCSGTLVSKRVVVAAAHCIFPGIGVDPPSQIAVFFGNDVSQDGTFIPVVDGKYDPLFDINSPDSDEDISVLSLDSDAPVAPAPMASLPPPGTMLTLVGFGITTAGGDDAGIKRVAHASIDQLQTETFTMAISPSGTCNGDSGGSAYYNDGSIDKLVGIHTRSDCVSFMLDERIDAHRAAFIQPFIDGNASCEADQGCAMNCPAPDPDCPCAQDGYCTALCTDLTTDPDCNKHCVADGQCALDCPVPDPDCPVCKADGVCVAACHTVPDPDCAETGGGGGGSSASGGAGSMKETTASCDCALSNDGLPGRGAWILVGLAVGSLSIRRRSTTRSRAANRNSNRPLGICR